MSTTTPNTTVAGNGIGAAGARTVALVTGILFVVTFITSIPARLLYGPVLDNADYILGAGADARVQWGAFLRGAPRRRQRRHGRRAVSRAQAAARRRRPRPRRLSCRRVGHHRGR